LKENGEKYHVMARELGETASTINMNRFKLYVDVAAAYILSIARGTLARSAALKKYKDNNARSVSIWETRFKMEKTAEAEAISSFLKSNKDGEMSSGVQLAVLDREIRVAKAMRAKTQLLVLNQASKVKLAQADVMVKQVNFEMEQDPDLKIVAPDRKTTKLEAVKDTLDKAAKLLDKDKIGAIAYTGESDAGSTGTKPDEEEEE
jgi:hypothetical protein